MSHDERSELGEAVADLKEQFLAEAATYEAFAADLGALVRSSQNSAMRASIQAMLRNCRIRVLELEARSGAL